ncbi:MAG: hypothetical protein JZU64_05720 [Rhodoferax sp.]|jgi:hypothetical protein|nr:hypothetical protein [Rhodoferax sp.]
MRWTSPKDLRAQVQKLWDKGELLRPLVQGQAFAPLRLRLTGPTSAELSQHFDEVRAWAAELRAMPRVRLVLREFRHRVMGSNTLPDEVWLDALEDAQALIGRQKEVRRFADLLELTRSFVADADVAKSIARANSQFRSDACQDLGQRLLPWLEKRPLLALDLFDAWPRLLSVAGWLQAHPRPGIYLRQVDLPGIDSKFIEAHRAVLAELFDLALPMQAIDASASGLSGFCRRYGFRDKPLRIRFRLLDATLACWPVRADPGSAPATLATPVDQDISLTQAAFERLDLPLGRVFITENEINFLAFPPQPGSLVIFGAGYGFDALAGAAWLQQCELLYWGDIDTHGFAILDQLRAHFPQVRSLLMDRATLLAHRAQWVPEPQPLRRDLPRLTVDELALFEVLGNLQTGDLLQAGAWPAGAGVRLEQERISFGWLQATLARLLPDLEKSGSNLHDGNIAQNSAGSACAGCAKGIAASHPIFTQPDQISMRTPI